MPISRVGYYNSGSVAQGTNDISEVLATDNFIFVIDTTFLTAVADNLTVAINASKVGDAGNKLTGTNDGGGTGSTEGFITTKFNRLKIQCQNGVIPGFSNSIRPANIHGFQQNFRGRKEFPRTLSLSYLESGDMLITKTLRMWSELMVGTFSGSGLGRHKTSAILYIFRPASQDYTVTTYTAAPVATFNYYNLFPQDISELALSGDGSNNALMNATFSYDLIGSSMANDFTVNSVSSPDANHTYQYSSAGKRKTINTTSGVVVNGTDNGNGYAA